MLLFFLSAVVFAVEKPATQTSSYGLVPRQGLRLVDIPVHDPWILAHRENMTYYLFTTLHNRDKIIAQPPEVWRVNHRRGTTITISDSPEGLFTLLKKDGPYPPADFMTLDGTFYVDPDGQPWMVYAPTWIQMIDGMMEAVRLKDDLTAALGQPLHLFNSFGCALVQPQGAIR
jgi:hypothetical protein